MKKHKQKALKKDMVNIMSEAFHTVINQSLQVAGQETAPAHPQKATQGGTRHTINLRMYLDPEVKTWDFTKLIQMVQFESPQLLVKILRQVHHEFAILNIQEQVTALNRHTLSINDYSEQIPNELYILKTLADNIEAITEV